MDPSESSTSSGEMLRLARAGDRSALNGLFARQIPPLRRWARGRLPRWSRSIAETTDLIQDAMLNAFKRLPAFEIRHRGALQAYLRESIRNRVKDELRSFARRAPADALSPELVDPSPSPLDRSVEREAAERYRSALSRLTDNERELIVGRLELGYTYDQLALACGRRSAEGARIAVRRALLRLAREMHRDT